MTRLPALNAYENSALRDVIFLRSIAREMFRDARLFNGTEYAINFLGNVFLNGVRSK